MKIRNGFVSNSSSSSFLVLFPHEITKVDELYKLMWTERNCTSIQKYTNFKKNIQERIQKSYQRFINEGYNDMNMTFDEFQKQTTDIVFKEIQEQGKDNYLRAIAVISGSFWLNDDGIDIGYGKSLKNSDDIKKAIEEFEDLEKQIDTFNWNNTLNADEEYERLENKLNDLRDIENIKNTYDEINEIVEKHPNMIFYTFSFSDEDGKFFSIMEHGGIFGDLPVYVESHH